MRLFNPDNKKHFDNVALIDTGADACVIPRSFAEMIGHNYDKGYPTKTHGVGGEANGYLHTTKIIILDMNREPICEVNDYKIECFETPCILLGVKGFLERFILEIDYPKRVFSLKYSKSAKYKGP